MGGGNSFLLTCSHFRQQSARLCVLLSRRWAPWFSSSQRTLVYSNNNKLIIIIIIIIIPGQSLWCWHHDSESLREFTRFMRWMQNSARRLGPMTKSTDLSHWPCCRQLGNHIHHRHLLLLSPKGVTIPQRVEGWVDLDGRLYSTQTVYLPVSSHPSK